MFVVVVAVAAFVVVVVVAFVVVVVVAFVAFVDFPESYIIKIR
jgi:hypothetical protein